MPLNIRPLTPELQAKAIAELNERPERIEADLEAFRAWLAKTPHIKARTDDQFLVNVLRGCKWSLERAKQKIDDFYTIRTALPEFFGIRKVDDEAIRLIKLGVIVPLPQTATPDGPRIVLNNMSRFDPDQVDLMTLFRATNFMVEVMLIEDDNLMVAGMQGIIDMKGVSANLLKHLSPVFMKKMAMVSQEGMPARQKGQYYVNMPSFMNALFNMFKTFLNEKMRSRMQVIGNDIEEIYKLVPKKILPAEYGGEAGTIDEIMDYWVTRVKEYAPFFEEESQYGTDEKKRPGRPKSAESLFGVDGSFRQLEIF